MKLSKYAKNLGVGYRTAWNLFKAGKIKGAYKLDTGTVIVPNEINDKRPKLLKLLKDENITKIVVEHKDRLSRFGVNYITELWAGEIVVINEVTEDEKDLMQDFISLVTSFTARLYGQRRSKRNTEKLIKELNK